MKIIVLSRSDAKKFKCDKPWAAISIADDLFDLPTLSKENRQDLLQLEFYDAEFETNDKLRNFKKEIAERIYEFVYKNKNVDVLLVHCLAGYSRSPAVAAAITQTVLKQDNSEYFSDTEKYDPNQRVYKIMLESFVEPDSNE